MRTRLIIQLLGTFVSIALTVVAWFVRPANFQSDVWPIGVLVVGLMFTMTVGAAVRDHAVDEKIDRLPSKIDRDAVVYLGDVRSSRQEFEKRLRAATLVCNTNIRTFRRPSSLSDYSPTELRRIIAVTKNFVRKGGTWNEVMSQDAVERVQEIRKRLRGDALKRFTASALDHAIPTTNFIIFEGEDSAYVMFGYGLHDSANSVSVFGTENPKIITHFKETFNALSNLSKQV